MARLGQLVLQRGDWDGRQLVSAEWIDRSTRIYANLNDGPFGYCWWIRPDDEGFAADGHGGQYIYVIPRHELVLVLTAEPYTVTHEFGTTLTEFEVLVRQIVLGLEGP